MNKAKAYYYLSNKIYKKINFSDKCFTDVFIPYTGDEIFFYKSIFSINEF